MSGFHSTEGSAGAASQLQSPARGASNAGTAAARSGSTSTTSKDAAPLVQRRSETEVYAAESQAAATVAQAKWNERIRSAYASVAASTPMWPSQPKPRPQEKPSSHALSYVR